MLQAEVSDFYNYTPVEETSYPNGALFTTNPATYPGTTTAFTNTIQAVLNYNGIYFTGTSSLTNIIFDGKKLERFIYTHDNGTVVYYLNGFFSVDEVPDDWS